MVLRILLADDHEVVRRGLTVLLRARPDWEVCGEASNGREAVESAQKLNPDIVVLDVGMPHLNGLEATRQIVKARPETRILILTLHDSDSLVQEVLNAGARGFLHEVRRRARPCDCDEALGNNKTYFTPKVASMVLEGYLRKKDGDGAKDASPRAKLTPREREIVQLLAEGKSSREVADALGLSVKTAETHRANIMRKLNLHSVSDLVMYAVRNNIVHVVRPSF